MDTIDDAEALREEGNTLFTTGNFDGARSKYEQAIDAIDSGMMATAQADVVKVKCLLNLAATHMKLEAWEPVLEACDRALKLDEGSLKARLRRARANMELGNNAGAMVDVREALALEPNSCDALRLKLLLDQQQRARRQAAAHQQKKAFSSFWGDSSKDRECLASGISLKAAPGSSGASRRDSKGRGTSLYSDKLSEFERGGGRVLCWMSLSVGGQVMPQRVMIELRRSWAPKAVENFRCLCTGERLGEHGMPLTYAGSSIHRVCKGFVLQGGDIVYKDGERTGLGMQSIYGSGFGNEYPQDAQAGNSVAPRPPRHLAPALVGMANNGRPESNGCQFYVTMDAAPWLDHDFVIIGHVVEGMRVLREVEALSVDEDDRPLHRVEILECGELAAAEGEAVEAARGARRGAAQAGKAENKGGQARSQYGGEDGCNGRDAGAQAGAQVGAQDSLEQGVDDRYDAPDDPGPLYDLDVAGSKLV